MSTSFAHARFPAPHSGARRARPGLGRIGSAVRGFDGARAASSLLLAAIVAALLVVADQVVDTWNEGHLLAAWIVLWTVAFAALALLAAPARRAANALRATVHAWNGRRVRLAQDEQYWQAALTDARLMADISRAMSAVALEDSRAYPYY